MFLKITSCLFFVNLICINVDIGKISVATWGILERIVSISSPCSFSKKLGLQDHRTFIYRINRLLTVNPVRKDGAFNLALSTRN